MFLICYCAAGQDNSEMADQFNVYFSKYVYLFIVLFFCVFNWFGPWFRHRCKVRKNEKPYFVHFLIFCISECYCFGLFHLWRRMKCVCVQGSLLGVWFMYVSVAVKIIKQMIKNSVAV